MDDMFDQFFRGGGGGGGFGGFHHGHGGDPFGQEEERIENLFENSDVVVLDL